MLNSCVIIILAKIFVRKMSLRSGNCYQINIEKDISGVKYQVKKNKSRRISFIRKKSRHSSENPENIFHCVEIYSKGAWQNNQNRA